jgi:hypothetical protein
MMGTRQIVTKEITTDAMWAELRRVVTQFTSEGLTDVEILFGFAWGNAINPTPDWQYIFVPLSEIEARIKSEEQNKTGKLGQDDLYIRHPSLSYELQFCHESDIHIWFEQRDSMIESVEAEWKAKGFEPKEWVKEGEKWIEQRHPTDRP